MLDKIKPLRQSVPCNGCTACCKNDMIALHPECGDVISDYKCHAEFNPVTGRASMVLDKQDNGDCVYLGPDGCSIHERAPVICREFDCRLFYLRLGRKLRRIGISTGGLNKETLDAGRARLHTLKP